MFQYAIGVYGLARLKQVIFIIDNFHSDFKLFSIKTKIPRVFSSLENNAINSIV
jgi:hypothetical protein